MRMMPEQVLSSAPPRTYRRPYKKARTGCTSCKARKIKCDETRPVCFACKKRYVDISCCIYGPSTKSGLQSKGGKETPKGSESALVPIYHSITIDPSGVSETNRTLELRLLHHYTKTTCKEQSLGAMVPLLSHPMWEIDIPQMAFDNDLVLNALLGLSAVHLLATNPDDQTLLCASRSYFDKALTKHRSEIVNLNERNAESLLVTACILAHLTWLLAHSQDFKKELYHIDFDTFEMCNGIKALLYNTKPWNDKYSFPNVYEKIVAARDQVHSQRFMESALKDIGVLSASYSDNRVCEDDKAAYEQVIDDLVSTYSMVATQTLDVIAIEQRVVTFLHRLPQRYIKLLKQEHPIAMALLARNIALLVYVEDDSGAWWVHGTGPNNVTFKCVWGIHGLLSPEWLWIIDWPLRVISKEIKLGSGAD